MSDFRLLYPPTIRFGNGCRAELPHVLADCTGGGPARAFFVWSASVASGPLGNPLRDSCRGLCVGEFEGVPHDPPLDTVDAILDAARAAGATALVAVGGGSVIDAAKAAAVLVPHPGSVVPYFRGRMPIPGPGVPLIALPTTAGTGAEITKNAVLTDVEGDLKQSLRSPHMVPRAALVDPELTRGCSAELTAHAGMDALTQAVESFISRRSNAVTAALARDAAALLLSNLERLVADPEDHAARTAVAQGSLLSAMAFSQSGLGAAHGLAHPLGHALGVAHGLTCAVLLPRVLQINAPVCAARLAELAVAAGEAPAPGRLIERVRELCGTFRIPGDLRFAGLGPQHFEYVLRNCRSGSMKANPRELGDDDILGLLKGLAGISPA